VTRALAAAALAIAATAASGCKHKTEPPPPQDAEDLHRLADYLRTLPAMDEAARTAEIRSWKLDPHTFERTVQRPYLTLYPDYAARFDDAVPALVAAFGPRPDSHIEAHRHYADDSTLTPSQFRIRWALPVEYPTAIAVRDGAVIDAVFAPAPDGHWGILANLDAIARTRVHAWDAACDAYLDRAVHLGRCGEVGWAIVDSALRGDRPRFDHSCKLAAGACGQP
jgi:hypothetical protein